MKLMLGLFLVVAVVLLLVWQFGISGFDPMEQAGNLKAKVNVGMEWEQVIDVHTPGKYRIHSVDADGIFTTGLPIKYDRKGLEDALVNPGIPFGFAFEYFFNSEHHYMVEFDSEGKVASPPMKMPSIGDMLVK